MSKMRNSNIELLRIVAMLFIISHHFLVHGMHIWQDVSWQTLPLLSINSACYIGVNVFVLISGYCTIRFDLHKLIRLYLLTALIGGICYFAHLFIDDASLGRSVVYNTLLSISHAPGTWFIKVYIYLFLLSPLVNKALEVCNKKQLHLILLSLTIISVYFGWFWHDEVNPDGFNLINFIWIYCIGYYLRHWFEVKSNTPVAYLLIWMVCSIINAVGAIAMTSYAAWTYNNPLVVIAAIAFFLFFVSFDFSSKIVNNIARCTLGVYLIHENIYISQYIYGERMATIYSSNIIYFIGSVLLLFSACAIVDYGIRKVLVHPILVCVSKIQKKIFSCIN